MSIETLTGDEFMHLDADTHRVALDQYNRAIDAANEELTRHLYSEQRERLLDRLTSLLQLRKLHKTRLAELEDEELAPHSPITQYHLNDLAPAL